MYRNFLIAFAEDSSVICTATMLERGDTQPATEVENYTAEDYPGVGLLEWARRTIEGALVGLS